MLYLTHSSTLKYETLPLNVCTTGFQLECLGYPVYLCGKSLLILKFSKDEQIWANLHCSHLTLSKLDTRVPNYNGAFSANKTDVTTF